MVEDPKVALAGAAVGRARRHRQRSRVPRAHHGGVDGGPDPSLQDGDAGRARPRGRGLHCVESPRGELGMYVVSDGEHRPYRVKIRDPSFVNLQAVPTMVEGGLVADIDRGDRVAGPGDGRGGPLMAVVRGRRARRRADDPGALPGGAPALGDHAAALPGAVGRGHGRARGAARDRRAARHHDRRGRGGRVLLLDVPAAADRRRTSSTCARTSRASCAAPHEVYEAAHEAAGIAHGEEISADGLFTVHEEECLGVCDFAPVVQIDFATTTPSRPSGCGS